MVRASFEFSGHSYTDVEVINPGSNWGGYFLISISDGYDSAYFLIEASSADDAIDEFCDSKYGHMIHVEEPDAADYDPDNSTYAGNDGRLVDLDNLNIHDLTGFEIVYTGTVKELYGS